MPRFSRRSKDRLNTCSSNLQRIMNEVVKEIDCTIICGHRSEEDQNAAFASGNSKVKYPNSKHNSLLSRAVDIVPYPEMWEDKEKFYYLAGYIQRVAQEMGTELRWGGDWDRDYDFDDQTFMDLGHFEET